MQKTQEHFSQSYSSHLSARQTFTLLTILFFSKRGCVKQLQFAKYYHVPHKNLAKILFDRNAVMQTIEVKFCHIFFTYFKTLKLFWALLSKI